MKLFQEIFLIVLMGFILGSCIKAPKLNWYLWNTNTLQFEGVNAAGNPVVIPGNNLQSNHLVCTDPAGFDALVNYINSKCD